MTGWWAAVITARPSIPPLAPGEPWECCMTMSESWSWVASDAVLESPQEILRTLVEVRAKGGNLLLNVGPRADGSIVSGQVALLAELAAWMADDGGRQHGLAAPAGNAGGDRDGPRSPGAPSESRPAAGNRRAVGGQELACGQFPGLQRRSDHARRRTQRCRHQLRPPVEAEH